LIAHHTKAPAFFVVAGRRKHLEHFFQSKAFLGEPTSKGAYRRLLKLDARSNGNIRVDTPNWDRKDIFRKLFKDYQNVSFTSQITTSSPQRYPDECPMFQYQAYAWRVLAPLGDPRFLPKNNRAYAYRE